MDNPNSVITVFTLQTFLNKLKQLFVKKNSDAKLTSLQLNNAGTLESATSSGDTTVSATVSSGNLSMKIVDGNGERTVATCEDESQDIKANTLNSACIIGGVGEDDKTILAYPGVQLPSGYNEYSSGYAGRILASRSRDFEKKTFSQSSSSVVQAVTLLPGRYNIGSGTKFRFAFNSVQTSTDVEEYWLDLTIPSVQSTNIISITFTGSPSIVWASGEPDWSKSSGYRFQIHIIGNIASVVTCYKVSEGGVTPDSPMTDFIGPLSEAIDTVTEANKEKVFQWILVDNDGANQVIKPIWHIGYCKFIDALGYVLYEPESASS